MKGYLGVFEASTTFTKGKAEVNFLKGPDFKDSIFLLMFIMLVNYRKRDQGQSELFITFSHCMTNLFLPHLF